MRRKEKEVTDKDIIIAKLNEAKVCHVGFSLNDKPYIVPVNFAYDGKCIFFHSAKEGRKINIIKKNNNVCIEVNTDVKIVSSDNPCKWTTKFYSFIGEGKAFIIDDNEEKKIGLDNIMKKYSKEEKFNYGDKALSNVAVIKIEIHDIVGKKSGY